MPGISGSQKAPLFALSGVARAGATRSGYHSAKVFILVNGVQRATSHPDALAKIMIDSLTVTETAGEPSTGSFETMGFDIASGHEVIGTMGSINNSDRFFGGYVLATDQAFAAKPLHKTVTCSLIDYNWQLNRIKVIGKFSGPADEIVRGRMAQYAPDWSVARVETGLAVIDEITFVEPVDLTVFLSRVATRIGASWRGNYRKELYFGVTDAPDLTNPQDLTVGNPTLLLERFGPVKRDRSQQVTRIHMEGGGSEAAADMEPGETILPLTLAPLTWYDDVGGVVVSGPQRISYTGRFVGGGGSLVGTGHLPESAPTLALASGSGVTTGSHDVAVVFETAAGTSLPGPIATITVGLIDAPTVAPIVGVPTFGLGPDPGVHRFAMSYVTAAGETTPTPVSADVTTVAGISDPTVAATAPIAPVTNGFGNLVNGNSYSYKYTWANANGNETLPSPASSTQTVGTAQRLQTGAPNCPDARCTRIYAYRSANGGGTPWTRITMYGAGTSTGHAYFDNNPGAAPLTFDDSQTPITVAAPTVNAATSNAVPLTGIENSLSLLVTSKNLYGTVADGSQLKLIAAIGPTQTAYTVTMLDASLGANAPTTNTAAANQITTSAPLGPTGTTGRRFYMNPITGGARKLALTIANNTAITGTITASDATLAAAGAEPSSDTSGLAQPAGQVLAGATSIPVAGLGGENGFQTTGGWAIIGNGQTAVRFGGITGKTLTGIPVTGHGSIAVTINYGSQITAAPALLGIGDTLISESTNHDNAASLEPTGALQRLGELIAVSFNSTIASLTLRLSRGGSPVGNIWVTIQTGSIGPSGVVLATSALVNVNTVSASPTYNNVTFTLPPTHLSAGTAFIVLHGDFPSDVIEWAYGFSGAPLGYSYDGASVAANVPASSFNHDFRTTASPIVYPIHKGDPVNLWVTVDDTDAQATLSAILDPTDLLNGAAGIIEEVLQDRRLSITETRERAFARLVLRSSEAMSLDYGTTDKMTHPSSTVIVDLDAPTNVHDTLKVQSVTRTWVVTSPATFPICDVSASNERFTFEQILNQGN